MFWIVGCNSNGHNQTLDGVKMMPVEGENGLELVDFIDG